MSPVETERAGRGGQVERAVLAAATPRRAAEGAMFVLRPGPGGPDTARSRRRALTRHLRCAFPSWSRLSGGSLGQALRGSLGKT